MGKFKEFLIKIKPSKRKLIQLYAALLMNSNIKGFITGEIYKGSTKYVCGPAMNCYSCPGATTACPIGSLQNALAESDTKTITYVFGIILLYAILFGRAICGWVCPAGLAQEILYKVPTPKLKKSKATRALSYLKYILFGIFVVAIPLAFGLADPSLPVPAFCKYICPVGTMEGAVGLLSNPNNADSFANLGSLFTWKFGLLVGFVLASIFIYRFFCRFFCPLGALYGLFNRIAVLGIHVDESKCNHCNSCVSTCKMDVTSVGDHECIMCGECKKVCAPHAITFRGEDLVKAFKEFRKKEEGGNNNE